MGAAGGHLPRLVQEVPGRGVGGGATQVSGTEVAPAPREPWGRTQDSTQALEFIRGLKAPPGLGHFSENFSRSFGKVRGDCSNTVRG